MTARQADVAATIAGVRLSFCAMNASEALSSPHELRPLVTSRTGAIVLSGTAAELADNPEVRRAYLGE